MESEDRERDVLLNRLALIEVLMLGTVAATIVGVVVAVVYIMSLPSGPDVAFVPAGIVMGGAPYLLVPFVLLFVAGCVRSSLKSRIDGVRTRH